MIFMDSSHLFYLHSRFNNFMCLFTSGSSQALVFYPLAVIAGLEVLSAFMKSIKCPAAL